MRDLNIRKPVLLEFVHQVAIDVLQVHGTKALFQLNQAADFPQKPGINAGDFVNGIEGNTLGKGIVQMKNPFPRWVFKAVHDNLGPLFAFAIPAQSGPVNFQALTGLLEGFVKAAADAHNLAHRFHLKSKATIGSGEFVEVPLGDFDNHIIQDRFKKRRGTQRNLIGQFVQAVAHRKFRGDLGNRISGRLGGEGGGARNTGVDFDGNQSLGQRIHGKLNIAASGKIPDRTHHSNGLIAHRLHCGIAQRHGRCYRNAIAGMDPHGVHVFDGTNNTNIVRRIP